ARSEHDKGYGKRHTEDHGIYAKVGAEPAAYAAKYPAVRVAEQPLWRIGRWNSVAARLLIHISFGLAHNADHMLHVCHIHHLPCTAQALLEYFCNTSFDVLQDLFVAF